MVAVRARARTDEVSVPEVPVQGPDRLDLLTAYVPAGVDPDAWPGSEAQTFMLAQLATYAAAGGRVSKAVARPLARLAVWCERVGVELTPEEALSPDTVERFTAAHADETSIGTTRSWLRRLGRTLAPATGWEAPPPAVTSRTVAPPYRPVDVARFVTDAARQPTEARTADFAVILALGLGAGLDGRWLTRIERRHIDVRADGVLVRVPEPAARVVPVWHAWEAQVAALAERPAGRLLRTLGAGTDLHGHVERLVLGPRTPRLSAGRLRSTWLVTHLAAGTRLPELARAAGLKGITTLSDLLSDVAPLDQADARRALRGRP